MEINLFNSFAGDAILLKADNKQILIDGGESGTYREIKRKITNNKLDLVVLTHYDDDHIKGLVEALEDREIKIDMIWANLEKQLGSKEVYEVRKKVKTKARGAVSCIKLQTLIKNLGRNWHEKPILFEDKLELSDELNVLVISPTIEDLGKLAPKLEKQIEKSKTCKELLVQRTSANDYEDKIDELLKHKYCEDKSLTNASSIVLLIKYQGENYLFTGDSPSSYIEKGLRNIGYNEENKLKLKLFKMPHHGSPKNFNENILNIIDCKNFLILSDGKKHGHPSKEVLVKLLEKNKKKGIKSFIYTNYKTIDRIDNKDVELSAKYDFEYKNTKQIKF